MENLDNNYPKPEDRKMKVRTCPVCKQEVKMKTGLQNWKNLFRMPTFEELITLFIIFCVIALYFVYQHDIKQYQTYINENCQQLDKNINYQLDTDNPLTNVNITIQNTTTLNNSNLTV